jgi:uncharacterized lipoprotein YddW (UPF0748 family)
MRKFFAILLVLLLFIPAFSVKGASQSNSEKFKAICIHGDDIAKEGVQSAIDKIAEFGYNAIFLLVKTPEGKVCYKSNFLPVEEDILSSLIGYAHKKSIKVYTYFPVVMDENFASNNPSEKMVNSGGTTDSYYVSLISQKYLDYIKRFLSELLQYDIDGIALDYIRFPNGNWDFSTAFLNYAKQNGIDTDRVKSIAYKTFGKPGDWKSMFNAYDEGDKDIIKWVDLRNSVVQNVATVLRNYIKSIKPDLPVGAFLVARGYRYDKVADAPSITESFTYQIVNFSQSPNIFKDNIDFLAPMVYLSSLSENSSYATIVANTIKNSFGDNFPVYIAGNPYGISTQESELEIFNSFKYSNGIILFRYPLFDMGKLTLENYPMPGDSVNATYENSNGDQLITKLVPENNDFMPQFKNSIFISNYFCFTELKLLIGNTNFTNNGTSRQMDVAPFIQNSRTFVPIRFISESLNSKVLWDGEKREVTIEGINAIVIKIDSKSYTVNGKEYQMDVAPFIQNSRTFVPIRFISESLNSKVLWDGEKREVTILNLFKIG